MVHELYIFASVICLQLTDAAFKQISKHCHHLKTLNINRCSVSLSLIVLFC